MHEVESSFGGNLLNANYLAYKARVEADGSAIQNEVATLSRFEFMDAQSIYSDYKWGVGFYAGNKLDGSSNVEKFYDLSISELDCTQSTPSIRPTSSYDFGGGSHSGFTNLVSASISELTWCFQLGTIGSNTGFEIIFADGAGTGGTSLRGTAYRWSDNTYVFSVQGQVVFSGTTVASNDKVIVTRSSAGLRVVVNGTVVVNTASSAPFDILNVNGLGALAGNQQFFNGVIKEFHKFHSDLYALRSDINNDFLI